MRWRGNSNALALAAPDPPGAVLHCIAAGTAAAADLVLCEARTGWDQIGVLIML